MKNFILSAAIFAFAGVSTVKANEIITPVSIAAAADSTANKVPVKLEELPEAVKNTLKANAYKEWTATTAFLITKEDKSTFYQVDVKKGTDVAYLQLSKDGAIIQ
jgi:hypothetical protein